MTITSIGEVKEPRKVDIKDFNCVACNLPATKDAKGLCSHCRVSRRVNAIDVAKQATTVVGRVWRWAFGAKTATMPPPAV